MNHTHNNTVAKAKRLVATALIVALCTQHATPALAITFDSTASDYFDTVEDFGLSGGSDNISVRFGTTLGEFLRFNRSADKFILSNDLDVRGTISGASLKIMGTASISGALVLEGTSTLSGGALRGFGLLTDCDDATNSKLLWDSTTGRFSCGTDTAGGSSGGLSLSDADSRYVRKSGDTMTGKLVLDTTSIDVKGSGSIVAYDPNDIVLVVRGTGSQTANLQEWQDVNGTSIANITAGGQLGAQYGNFSSLMSTTYADVTTSLNVSGNAILGSDSTDYVAFNADVNTSINPDANVTYNLGSDSYRWNYVYGGNSDFSGEIYGAGVGNVANVTMRNITSCNGSWSLATDMNGSVYCDTDDSSSYYFNLTDGFTSESVSSGDSVLFQAVDSNISVNVTATDTVRIGFNNPGFITSESDPVYNANSYAVGMNQHVNTSSDVQFQNMNATGIVTLGDGTSDTITFNGLVNTSILPYSNNAYEFGNASNAWSTGYFNNINVYDNANTAFLNVSANTTIGDNIADTVSVQSGNWSFSNETEFNLNGGPLRVRGVLSGVTLYATQSFSGAGLTDCDTAGTSKLLWDATTGRFSCGTDQTGGSSGGGMDYATASGIFLKRSGGTMTGTLTIDTGTAGRSSGTGLVVYERATFLSGATLSGQLLIRTNGDPGTPPADNLYLYAKKLAGRSLLKAKGPSGLDYAYQPSLFQNSIATWFPASGTTAGSVFGWAFTSAGTVSHPALASTNMLTQMRRTRWASATTANAIGGIFNNTTVTWRGNAANLGGFFLFARFAQNVNTNGARAFVGLSALTSHIVAAEPSAATNIVGMGYDAADSSAGNWRIMHNDGSGTATEIDLGASAVRDTTSIYDLFLFAAPNGSTIGVRVVNVSTNTVVYDGTLSTDLPTSTTFLRVHAGGGPAASAVAQNFELNRLYLETDQ